MTGRRARVGIGETNDPQAVLSFYAKVGYGNGVDPDDRLLVARNGEEVIAALRLCPEGGTSVLRGMYVAAKWRGRGLGGRMLEAVSVVMGADECWCIPFDHLVGFYSRIGFVDCDKKPAPSFLEARRDRYLKAGHSVVIMHRPATTGKSGNPGEPDPGIDPSPEGDINP